MMSAIGPRNTKPEITVRKALHSRGFRFRLHAKGLPGSPDIVLKRWNTAVFVHGCFWHRHGCHLFRLPSTRQDWWKAKIDGNAERDARAGSALKAAGWRVLTVWECAVRGKGAIGIDQTALLMEQFIKGNGSIGEISS